MKKLPIILEPEEAQALIRIPNKRYDTGLRNKAMLSVMLNMGLRLSEVCNLRPGDINLTKSKLRVVGGKGQRIEGKSREKTGSDRDLGIPEATGYLLSEWREVKPKSEWFFCTLAGHKVIDRYIQAMVSRYAVKAGITKKISPHSLRHSYATEYYRRTRDIETLRRILGHSNIATTTIYISLADVEVENGMKEFKEFI
jgi:site-specific recombinase XerD